MNEFVLRLMKCARSYETFISAKLLSKQNINADELASIQQEAISTFPELKTHQQGQGSETVELELFNKVLHNMMRKIGFRVPEEQCGNTSSIYIRR
ncbi:hypothetical protein BJL85_11895 [Vibrio parahaemolyticus]|uniref:hypothetical protein n=1 Tax=Vibrio parahaemolyticus TaxID=670 RepID=UPI0007DBFB87|nr:hypothetical protein [Vibrio parahaemolyticus]AVW97670.1 hypothetical protein DA442_22185 [Vibrio parahaemolyticus]EGQ8736337.1 hypothetical protein [Vibrio parahaemolyticus]EGQ8906283.1 hypothetical protein [Vibrio parahaemolyticus]EGR3100180.1 hypothetical protein [Vibrio parahaemolyticus]MCZ5939254.1 hypothetical protein [Vibrio parahaemolyticus]